MDASQQRTAGRGLWNKPRATQYSKETQDMVQLMMQESRLASPLRRQINKCLKNGTSLPLTFDPAPSTALPQPKTRTHDRKCLPVKSQRRSAEACRSGDSYVREKFRPGPTRDLEKEKRRLQNIMATGREQPKPASSRKVSSQQSEEAEKDRHQEVLDEIENRQQFLAEMASLGVVRNYIGLINTEISQLVRELEVLDITQKKDVKDGVTSERKGATAEQMAENLDLKETGEKTSCRQ